MAVAHDQITELMRILKDELSGVQLLNIFLRMKKTKAYSRNKSFKETVDRMLKKL